MPCPYLDVAGISIDCPEPVDLARFYIALLGGELLWENPSSSGIRTHSGLNIVASNVGQQKQRINRTRGGEFSSTPPATPSA